eukprot:2194086-Prymnesium_polylepis.1
MGVTDCIEVEKRGATLMWAPGQPRQFMLNDGKVLKCHMPPNHLAWLKLKPIMDSDRLMVTLRAYQQSAGCTRDACVMCDQPPVGASSSGTPR